MTDNAAHDDTGESTGEPTDTVTDTLTDRPYEAVGAIEGVGP